MSRLHTSASSGLHCPLLTNSPLWDKRCCREQLSWGWKYLLLFPDSWITPSTASGRVCPGYGSLLQLLPETLVWFFSAGKEARVKGEQAAVEGSVLYTEPSRAPLHIWFSRPLAEHVNDIGRVARVIQEDNNPTLLLLQ